MKRIRLRDRRGIPREPVTSLSETSGNEQPPNISLVRHTACLHANTHIGMGEGEQIPQEKDTKGEKSWAVKLSAGLSELNSFSHKRARCFVSESLHQVRRQESVESHKY